MTQVRHVLPFVVLVPACAGSPIVCGEGTVEHDGVCRPGDGDADTDSSSEDDCRVGDADGDDHVRLVCGGDDCDDALSAVFPGADDSFDDGVDQNCDGTDGIDADLDGHARDPGDDCDDADPRVHAGAPDPDGDCVDEDCDGSGGRDDDGDGFVAIACGGDDCDDADAARHRAAADVLGDGDDTNCDGIDGEDLDGDGHASVPSGGDDCNDGEAETYPGAVDLVGDLVDEDCGGEDGIDVDGDDHASRDSGGDDCDDLSATVHPGAVEDEDWTSEAVDEEGNTGWTASIALDGDVVHIGYEDTIDRVRHAKNALGAWVLDTVTTLTPGSYGSGTALALDGGFSHLVYYDNYPSVLGHSSDDPFPWATDIVYGVPQAGMVPSITASAGVIHVVYTDYSQSALRYATDESGSWVNEVVDAVGCGLGWGSCLSSVVVDDGVVHVAYFDHETGVNYAKREAGVWTIVPIEATDPQRPSIARDGGTTYVTYGDEGEVRVATDDGAGFVVEAADDTRGGATSVVVEGGVVHIAAYSGELRYGTNLRGAWEWEVVDGDGNTGSFPSLALGADVVHVAYYDVDRGDLRYARRSRPDGIDSDCDGRD